MKYILREKKPKFIQDMCVNNTYLSVFIYQKCVILYFNLFCSFESFYNFSELIYTRRNQLIYSCHASIAIPCLIANFFTRFFFASFFISVYIMCAASDNEGRHLDARYLLIGITRPCLYL